jgi:predicted nucleic acid-binding protein
MPNFPCVFDSWAIFAFLNGEPAAPQVKTIISEAHEAEWPMCITAVNLGEIWYGVARRQSSEAADQTTDYVRRLGLRVVDADWELTRLAARFKSQYRLSYADCFAAALARQLNTEVITGDPEFRQLEQEVKVHWLTHDPVDV